MGTEFDRAWERESSLVRQGRGRVDLGPGVGRLADPPVRSLVWRLDEELSSRLGALAEEVAAHHPGHYVYPVGDHHVTVLEVTAAVGEIGLAAVIAAIGQAALDLEPATFSVTGVGLFRPCVFAQIEGGSGGVHRVRRHMAAAVAAVSSQDEPVGEMAFANILRFTTVPDPAVVDTVRPLRGLDLGQVRMSRLELLQTDKVLSKPATTVLAAFDLGRPG